MKKNNSKINLFLRVVIVVIILITCMQFNKKMTSGCFATTIEDMTNYGMVLRDFNDSYTIYDAYVVIVKANFSDFVDDNIYDLLSITYSKKGWQEPDKNIDVDQVRVLIAMKGGWMNRFTDKVIKDEGMYKPSYQLIYKKPNNNGFIEGTESVNTLPIGTVVDSYGATSSYLYTLDLGYKERALTPGTKETQKLLMYKVLKPLQVKSGNVQPWFGVGTGTGTQYYLQYKDVQYYVDNGYLEVVSGKDIISFEINKQTKPAIIDTTNHTVNIELATGTDVTNLEPTITLLPKAKVNPASGVAKDFTNPVTYTVTAKDGRTQEWLVVVTVKSPPVKSSENEIKSFVLSEQTGVSTIDVSNHKVTLEVKSSADITNLVPTIEISSKATISAKSGVAKDFTNPVTYTVTAEDGTTQEWLVVVTVKSPPPVKSSENEIKSFVLSEQTGVSAIDVSNHKVTIEVKSSADITNLAPTIEISSKATISAKSGVAKDFTNPVTYTVTAEDGTTQEWLVVVTVKSPTMTTKSITSYNSVTLVQNGDVAHDNVQFQTANTVICALPSVISVKLEDGKIESVPIIWNDIDGYNAKVAGYYTFESTWGKLPSGIDNNDNINAPTCEVEVAKGSTGGGSSSYVPRPKTPTEKAGDKINKAKMDDDGVIKVGVEAKTTREGKTSFKLPNNFLKNKIPIELTIENRNLQITLINNMFTEEQKKVELIIESAKKEELGLTKEEKEKIKDLPVYKICLKIDGKIVGFSGNQDIAITINVANDKNKEDHKFVAVYYDRRGNIQVLKSSYCKDGKLYFKTKHLSDYGIMYVKSTFKDIDNNFAKEAIEALVARGIIRGFSEEEFRPEDPISRADLVTLVVRTFDFSSYNDSSFTNDSEKVFEDVDSSEYYAKSIMISKEIGLVKGCGNNLFKPLEFVNRHDLVVILKRAIEISKDYSNVKFNLEESDKEKVTRADIANALYNIMKTKMK